MEPIIARDRWGNEHEVAHGTATAYNRHKCRCEDCRAAWAEVMRRYRNSSGTRSKAEHGTRSKYVGGCRCDGCRKANSDYQSERQRLKRQGISMRAEWEID
jgi:hypothetical protein